MAKQAGRLIVVSARAPFTGGGENVSRAPGGLVSALLPLMQRARGTWIAAGNDQDATSTSDADFQVIPVSIPSEVRRPWYAGASTGALWPLAHGFVERCRFRRNEARAYLDVNKRVAEVVFATAPLRGTVWVHDYQLALVPALVRARRPDLTIGFFWHVPWPGPEVFRTLPWSKELVEGLLGADLVGLHVPRYATAFAGALQELAIPYEGDGDGLLVANDGRLSRVVACPIGIDVGAWSALGRDANVQANASALRANLGGSRLLLAVDRIDYSKGIVERLEAFERMLEQSSEAREHATLVQIAVPSREMVPAYRALRESVEAAVGRILGRFGSPTRRPVHFFARSYAAEELAAFYLAADVALVTPMRDGMNLVAFEYVATRPGPHGRLVLSTMTGAADVLRGAWLVNPYDEDALQATLSAATLSAETSTDSARMAELKRVVSEVSLDRWTSNFMSQLEQANGLMSHNVVRREVRPRARRAVGSSLTEPITTWMNDLESVEPRRRGV
ncbi:MAG: trehalose-6-phosphate synthase [Polyangiaceae bacterium]|nr:trehalose-6-phosphate synthase [Polyangiaceae bacterium]